MKYVPYIIIAVLLGVVFFQKRCSPPIVTEVVKIDTLYDTTYIHDTVPGETEWVYSHLIDTLWKDSIRYVPDTSYEGLYKQYIALGNELFTTNAFSTKFPIDSFGYVIVEDTVFGNKLITSRLISNLSIPEKTIVIEKWSPKVRELYFGGGATYPFGANTGLMYKDLKDRILGFSVGANGRGLNYNLSYYVKIK